MFNNCFQEMEDLINYKEFLDLRKKELLHKRWTDRVYQPIRRQVVKEIKSREFGELFQRKRQLYKEYLEHVNKKVGLSVLTQILVPLFRKYCNVVIFNILMKYF